MTQGTDEEPRMTPMDGEEDGKESAVAPARKKSGRWSWKRILVTGLIAVAVIAGGTWGVRYWLHARLYESTDNAFIDGDVIPVSARVSGHVERVLVEDNQVVSAGDVLAKLDARDFEVQLAQAQAALHTAQANAAQAQADVAADEARHDVARTELVRFTRLLESNSASQQEYTNAVAAEQVASAELNASRKKVIAQQALAAEAQAAVRRAELTLSYATIIAPRDGRVTRKTVEPGAFVQPGQTLLAIVPDAVWVTANFKETQLTHMRAGQAVDIEVDAYPGMKLRGVVDSIQAGTGARFSLLPPENATGNYVKVVQRVPVKITFEELTEEQMRKLGVGLSVVPEVRVR